MRLSKAAGGGIGLDYITGSGRAKIQSLVFCLWVQGSFPWVHSLSPKSSLAALASHEVFGEVSILFELQTVPNAVSGMKALST